VVPTAAARGRLGPTRVGGQNSGVDITIRPRADEDLDGVVRALESVMRTDGYPGKWPADPSGWLRGGATHGAWVAERGGEIVGHVVLRRAGKQAPVRFWSEATGRDGADCCVLARLFVVAAARRDGVGEALVMTASAAAADLGLCALLDVVDEHLAAIRLYRRLGWTPFATYEERFDGDGPLERLYCFAAPGCPAMASVPAP
jgi:GNAT superfamily N-acetyltransferase